jgi:hypothetical protein
VKGIWWGNRVMRTTLCLEMNSEKSKKEQNHWLAGKECIDSNGTHRKWIQLIYIGSVMKCCAVLY